MPAAAITDEDIRSFNERYDSAREISAVKARLEFVRAFPLAALRRMKLSDYVVGQRAGTFCHYVEAKTRSWASIQGATSLKFGVYYGRTKRDATQRYRFASRFGSSVETAFGRVREALLSLVETGEHMDFASVDRNPLSQMFKAKILSLYFPETYLNVCSEEHLQMFAEALALTHQDSLSAYQNSLVAYKNAHPTMRSWNNPRFMAFLYDRFLPGHHKQSADANLGRDAEDKTTIPALAEQLNFASANYAIGRLQQLRAQLRSLSRAPCDGIFASLSIRQDFAFHFGGRRELQFNIGLEEVAGHAVIRHCVAFSFETSPTLPTIDPLVPKVGRFNAYLAENPSEFVGFKMWHWDRKERQPDTEVSPIPETWVRRGNFIALGRYTRTSEVNAEEILKDFDRLLPLYVFVESDAEIVSALQSSGPGRPGPAFKTSTTAVLSARTLEIELRHKRLQATLHDCLVREGGAVDYEVPLDTGGKVDACVTHASHCVFYELKTYATVQECIRAALGQLLEYAYWPKADRAKELVVVGEADVTSSEIAYLQGLRERFGLPIWYRQIDERRKTLGDKH